MLRVSESNVIMGTRISGIRSAAVTWEDYQKFLAADQITEQIDLAMAQPVIAASLEEFSPYVYDRLRRIRRGILDPESKKGRKALRHLAIIMARATTRSTPSRLLGRVGKTILVKDQSGIHLKREWQVCAIEKQPTIVDSDYGRKIRWNPSALIAGDRFYVTVPRSSANNPNASVRRNDLIDLVRKLTATPVDRTLVIDELKKKYSLSSGKLAEQAVRTMLNREFLLNESARTFATTIDQLSPKVREAEPLSQCELVAWLRKNRECDIESSRDATIGISDPDLEIINKAYHFLLDKGLCETADKGLAAEFAKLLHERYSYARVRLSELVRPGTGISYTDVLRQHAKNRSHIPNKNLVILASQPQLWVNLLGTDLPLEDTEIIWRGPKSFAVPVSCLRDADMRPLFIVSDGSPGLPAETLTARYRAPSVRKQKESSAETEAVGLDWTSASSSTNAIREATWDGRRLLNVNSFRSPGSESNELTADEIWLWSDGSHVHVEDRDERPVHIRPQSMLSINMYPDWLKLLLLVETDSWPAMSVDWGSIADYHDRLPGVRYGNVILTRPRYRYRGEISHRAFNTWCSEIGIGPLIRLGTMDRKVLVDRRSRALEPALKHLLESSDYWVEDASCEHYGPFAVVSDSGARIYSELVVEIDLVNWIHDEQRSCRPALVPNANDIPDVFLIPGVSSLANLEIVPREGRTTELLSAIHAELSNYEYFIRYHTEDGQPCIRLRISRDYLNQQSTKERLSALLFDGWARDISERVHRLEVERYGGQFVFSAFQRLFALESHFISELAACAELDAMTFGQKTSLIKSWMKLLAKAEQSTVLDSILDFRSSRNKVVIDTRAVVMPCIEKWNKCAAAMQPVMSEISVLLEGNHAPWAAAAHMFCNRLGVSIDEESRVWRYLGDVNHKGYYSND